MTIGRRSAWSVVAAFLVLVLAAPASADTCGDANCTNSISATDALVVLKKAVFLPVTCPVCRCDVNNSGGVSATDALVVLKKSVFLPVTLTCAGTDGAADCTGADACSATTTTVSTPTTTLPSGELGVACTSAEVFVVPGGDLDAGWTGVGHNAELIEGSSITIRIRKRCGGDGDTCTTDADCSGETCDLTCHCDDPDNADCEATGPTHPGNCLTSLTDCDADSDCPAGETCQKFFGGPLPLSSAGVPVCITTYFASDITGTANSQTGEGVISVALRSRVHLGLTDDVPCPRCGSPTDSGLAIGATYTCEGGSNHGDTCTVNSLSSAFGGTSTDCPPEPGQNISGSGLAILFREVTTASTSKTAALTCAAPYNYHPDNSNGLCSDFGLTGNFSDSCTANSDCSRCIGSDGKLVLSGTSTVPCTANSDCGSGETCATFPTQPVTCGFQCPCGFCDDGDGAGLDSDQPCFNDNDCPNGSCLTGDSSGGTAQQAAPNECPAGQCGVADSERCHDQTSSKCEDQPWIANCTSNSDCTSGACITENKPCFESVISRSGTAAPLGKYCIYDDDLASCTSNSDCTASGDLGSCVDDSSAPVSVGLFCIPPTASSAVNGAGGITGPGAIQFATVIVVCRCGDGTVGCDEECDDSNTTSGDGCDENCWLE